MIKPSNKKKISLLIALVFAFTVIMPLSAFAASDDYTDFSSTYRFVTSDDDVRAGVASAVYNGDALPTGTDEIVVRIDLPTGVEFSTTPTEEVNPTGVNYTAAGEPTFNAGSRYIEITYTANQWVDLNGVQFDFNHDPDATPPINKYGLLDIDSDFAGDLKVHMTVTGIASNGDVTFTDWDDLTIAKVAGADINVTADSPKTQQIGSNKEMAKITIKESQAGAFKDGQYVQFDIMTNGVEFTGISGFNFSRVDKADERPEAQADADGIRTNPYFTNDDNDRIRVYVTPSTGLPGQIEFTPRVDISPNVTGDIKIRVSSNNSDLSSTTLTVGTVGDTTGVIEKLKDNDTVVYAGSNGTELDVSFEINTADESNWRDQNKGKVISMTLNNGKFVDEDGERPLFNNRVGTLYNSDKSVYYTIRADEGKSIKVDNIYVKCDNDVEVGDIELTFGGNAGVEGTIVIGEFAQPFTVTSNPVNIMSESLNQAAADIIITEVDGEALEQGQYIVLEVPSGIELRGTVKVDVEEGNIDVDVTNDKDYIYLEIEGDSSDASTIRISNIKYDTGRLALYGPVELDVSVAYKDGDKYEYEGVMTTVANAIVADTNTVTATFTLGDEGVSVVNGRTLVQVNLLCDVLGLQKSWDSDSKTAYFVKDGKVVAFPMGENAIYINGVKVAVDQGGMIINDFTYATLRGLEMAFGGELDWDNDTKTATFVFNK